MKGELNFFPTNRWWFSFLALTAAAFWTRFYKLDKPEYVCWDETHFGKHASYYINHTYFFDVHPPLAKMLIALSGSLSGYNGSFPFVKPGDAYNDIPYLGMRIPSALLGALLIPLVYLNVWTATQSLMAAELSSLLALFDTGTLTLTQFILLDPYLMFFVLCSSYSLLMFKSTFDRPFTPEWWFWLSATGVSIACTASVKFVGLFTIALVGIYTIKELWEIYCNLTNSMAQIVRHFVARVLCLILLPVVLYVAFFAIHFQLLYKSGTGDGMFSSAFQSVLEGNTLHNRSLPRHLVYGAAVTIKNSRLGGAYLHSHWHLYPKEVGPEQQQITTYGYKDENNWWKIKRWDYDPIPNDTTIEYVRHGDLVRLEHVTTTRNMHSHKEPAPVTKSHYQVSGYGTNGTGDENDVWRIEVFEAASNDTQIETLTSKIRLIHYNVKCGLYATRYMLPKWGWEQMEVTCDPSPSSRKRDPGEWWIIEDNHKEGLPQIHTGHLAPGFAAKFIESHVTMFDVNGNLKPKIDDPLTSRPWHWPLNYQGQVFFSMDYKIYLLGNPVVFWANLAMLILYPCVALVFHARQARGVPEPEELAVSRWLDASTFFYVAWALHYVPFYYMGRVLYFHHYFPAFLFSCMVSGVLVDFLLRNLSRWMSAVNFSSLLQSLFIAIFGILVFSFYVFCPFSYGLYGPRAGEPNSTVNSLKWLESWDI